LEILSEVLAGQERSGQFRTEEKRFFLLFGFTALALCALLTAQALIG